MVGERERERGRERERERESECVRACVRAYVCVQQGWYEWGKREETGATRMT